MRRLSTLVPMMLLSAFVIGCGGVAADNGSGPATGGGASDDAASPTTGTSSGSGVSTGAGGSAGTTGSGGNGGSGLGGAAGSSGTGGSGGVPANDGGSAGAGNDSAAPSPFVCLATGEEKLVVDIAGTPSFSIATPSAVICMSRYLSATADSDAMLDLVWNGTDAPLSVVVRMYKVTPGQTGTFTPFSVLIARGSDGWPSLGDKCAVTITSSTKIGEMPRTSSLVDEFYKVAGSMRCGAGWTPTKPTDELKTFEFATRVTFLRQK